MRVGQRGNALVRKSEADSRAEMTSALKWTPAPPNASKKAEREEQNELALGGLRNPWKAVDKTPGLRTVAEGMRKAFDRVVAKFPSVLHLADHFGTPDIKEPDEAGLD